MLSALSATSTLAGMATGFLATRDMLLSLSHYAQHFTTDTGSARFTISHYTLGCRHDGHTKAIHYRRDILIAAINTKTRATYALNLLNYGATSIILKADIQLRLTVNCLHCEVV